jgi:hypothetical protein
MKVSDIITTERRTFQNGRDYQSTLTGAGDNFSGSGKTPAAAEQALLDSLRAAEKHAYKRRYFWSPSGRTVFFLYWLNGWCYDITDPSRDHPSITQIGNDSEEEAVKAVQRHAAAYES